jgi:transaldolase
LARWPASSRLKAERRNDHGAKSQPAAAPEGRRVIWPDALSREMLDIGWFAELIDDYGVTGVTFNPTIFAKPSTGSDRYDSQLRTLVAGGERGPRGLFFSLALDDIRAAARLL